MEEGKKKGRNLHFIYVAIILGTIIMCLLAAIFFKYESAWQFLSFVGVALSLVLAIIAILITLIDVAGQKQQVFNISKSAEEMKKIVDEQHVYLTELKSALDKQNDSITKSMDYFSRIDEYLNGVEESNAKLIRDIKSEMENIVDTFGKYAGYEISPTESNSEKKDNKSKYDENHAYNLEMISPLLNYRRFLTIDVSTPLNEDEKQELLEQFSEDFKGIIKLQFFKGHIALYFNMFSVNPFRDSELIKLKAEKIVRRFLDEKRKN